MVSVGSTVAGVVAAVDAGVLDGATDAAGAADAVAAGWATVQINDIVCYNLLTYW